MFPVRVGPGQPVLKIFQAESFCRQRKPDLEIAFKHRTHFPDPRFGDPGQGSLQDFRILIHTGQVFIRQDMCTGLLRHAQQRQYAGISGCPIKSAVRKQYGIRTHPRDSMRMPDQACDKKPGAVQAIGYGPVALNLDPVTDIYSCALRQGFIQSTLVLIFRQSSFRKHGYTDPFRTRKHMHGPELGIILNAGRILRGRRIP